MRYPVDYVRYAAKEIRKIEGRMWMGEGGISKEELQDLLKTVSKALEEIANGIEGLERIRD